MEDTLITAADEDLMLPAGWSENGDFFDLESWGGENGGGSDEDEAPTTGSEDVGGEQSAEDEHTEEPVQEPEVKSSRKVRVRFNHSDELADIDAMTDEELAAHIQKSKAYDRDRFRKLYNDQIDKGMTPELARLAAAGEVGQSYSLEDDPAPEAGKATIPERDVAAEMAQLKALYPGFTEMPDEVAKAYASGAPLLTAYVAYREKQSAKAAEELRKENEILKQNAAAAAKAPVRGVAGGEKAQSKPDYLLEGFDSDW